MTIWLLGQLLVQHGGGPHRDPHLQLAAPSRKELGQALMMAADLQGGVVEIDQCERELLLSAGRPGAVEQGDPAFSCARLPALIVEG